MTANRSIDHATFFFKISPGQSKIHAFGGSVFDLLAERILRPFRFGNDQQTAGVFVQSMDDTRPHCAIDAGPDFAMSH